MRREEKRPMELRPVDEDVRRERDVIRLQKPGEIAEAVPEEPVRLGKPAAESETPSLLFVPERREVEVRTHQPGIEALIEESAIVEATEQSWGGESANRHPIPWGWFALIGLVIVAAVVWSLAQMTESRGKAVAIRKETDSALISEQIEEAEARALIERLESLLAAFFSCKTIDGWQGMVRQPERVMPLIRDYHAIHPEMPGPLRSVRVLEPITIDRHANFWMASVMLASGELRSLLIETDGMGEPRLDWETFVCHQPMPWDEFARNRPQDKPMDFRVYVEADHFFSHEFSDSNQWLSFRLTALDADETLFGYLRTDHEDVQRMLACLRYNQGRKTSLILRLNVPHGLQSPRGVVIEKLMSPRWIYLTSPSLEP